MNAENTEADLGRRVYEFLLSKGYPRHAIAFGSSFPAPRGNRIEIDIAILGRPIHNYVAFIELTHSKSEDKRRIVARRFRELLIYTRQSIPCFLIEQTIDTEVPAIGIYRLDDGLNWVQLSPDSFPAYEALIWNSGAQRSVEQVRRRSASIDTLTRHCRFMFAFIVIILGLDLAGMLQLRLDHLYFVLVLAALIVIPEISEITTSGFSFKRNRGEKENEKEK